MLNRADTLRLSVVAYNKSSLLTAFKGNPSHGAKYKEAEKTINAKTPFHNVRRPIILTSNAKLENINKDQFLQSVDDNLTRRLCQKEDESSSEFLQDLGRNFL